MTFWSSTFVCNNVPTLALHSHSMQTSYFKCTVPVIHSDVRVVAADRKQIRSHRVDSEALHFRFGAHVRAQVDERVVGVLRSRRFGTAQVELPESASLRQQIKPSFERTHKTCPSSAPLQNRKGMLGAVAMRLTRPRWLLNTCVVSLLMTSCTRTFESAAPLTTIESFDFGKN